MGGLLLKLRTWWEVADRTQKTVTVIGGAFLALLLFSTYYFASQPKMTMAFGGLSPADQGMVTAEIQKLGIPVETDPSGGVLVPSDKVAEVRSKLATAGKLPVASHVGNESLKDFTLMGPPNVEQERLKVIMEGELARSIEMIDGVASARVHLVRGERTAWASEKKPATASIFLTEKAGGAVTTESARAIAMLVANGVSGLEQSKVFVMDNAGRPLFNGADAMGASSQANEKLAAEQQESLRRERDLQAKLDSVVGPGNALVTVNLEMDFTQEQIKTTDVKLKDPKVVEATSEGASKSGMPNLNPLGTGAAANDANTAPGTPPGGTASAAAPAYASQHLKYDTPSTVTETTGEREIGTIKAMTIAVLVDKDKVKDTAAVQAFLDSYAKANKAEATVTPIVFDRSGEAEAKKSAGATSSRETMQQVMSFLPIVALLVVAFLVMKAIAKAATSQTVMVHALPNGTLSASMPMLEGGGHGPGGQHEPVGAMEEAVQALSHRSHQHQEDVGEIEERMNKPLEQLKRMAQDRPESVALLIKSWLLEERR